MCYAAVAIFVWADRGMHKSLILDLFFFGVSKNVKNGFEDNGNEIIKFYGF